jgi:phenylacetate-CoA ligase
MLADPSGFDAARAELAYAYERQPFYKSHLDGAGLHPREIRTPADWDRVRPTQKADFRRHFPAGVLANGLTLAQPGLLQTQSSGTTGERLTSVLGLAVSRRRVESCFTINPAFAPGLLWEYRKRLCVYIPPNCTQVECANPNLGREARMVSVAPGAKPRLTLPVYHDVLTTPDSMTRRAADELASYQPHLLIADPNYLAFLTRFMRRANMPPPPLPCILTGYSRATKVARRQIASFFGPQTAMAETIGMTEFCLAVAMECRDGHLHLDTASYYAELLTGGRPTEPGELGELYLTSLGDTVSPHIRYRTGDLYRRLAPAAEAGCPCGSRFPALRFEGRRGNMLSVNGAVALTPADLDEVIGSADWLDLYQLEQTSVRTCLFRFIPNERDDGRQIATIRERLVERLAAAVDVRVERTNYIACERSGKFQPVVAHDDARAS